MSQEFNKSSFKEIAEKVVVAVNKILWDTTNDKHMTEPIRLDISFYPSFLDDSLTNMGSQNIVFRIQGREIDLKFTYSYEEIMTIGDWLAEEEDGKDED